MDDPLQPKDCARFLKAMADPERLKIVQALQRRPHNVSELAELLSVEIANVSHHLGVLRNAGLVHDEKQGKFVVYSLNPELFRPGTNSEVLKVLDLGCCRLELEEGS